MIRRLAIFARASFSVVLSVALSVTPLAGTSKPDAPRAVPASGSSLGSVAAAPAVETTSPDLRKARERWARLTPEEQRRARANYERYQKLSEEERIELRRRAERMKREREQLRDELPDDVRAELSELPREKRRQVMCDLFAAKASEEAHHIRAKLPEDLLERIETAAPEKRSELLRAFKQRQRGRVTLHAIESMGRRLELEPERIERLKTLPADKRARAVLELRQQLTKRKVAESGLPVGLSKEEWAAWVDLSPEEFYVRMRAFRQERMDRRRTDAERYAPVPPSDVSLSRVMRRLAEAVRPNPRDALELAELTRPERKLEMGRRRRARCMQLIQNDHLLPADRSAELEALSDEEFIDVMRAILHHTGYIDSHRERRHERQRRGSDESDDDGSGGPRGGRPGRDRR